MAEQRKREKGEDERFCSECGDPVKRVAVVCVHCGAELGPTVGRQEAWSGTRLEPEVAGFLCYLFAWLTGIIFLLVEKDDHAALSLFIELLPAAPIPVQMSLARALGAFKDRRANEALEALLSNDAEEVREAASWALEQMPGRSQQTRETL